MVIDKFIIPFMVLGGLAWSAAMVVLGMLIQGARVVRMFRQPRQK